MKMEESASAVTQEVISGFESMIGAFLPQDFKNFILECNGGRPEDDWCFDFVETGDFDHTSSVLNEFLSFSDEYEGLQNAYINLVEAGEIPPGLVPIATDPGGNDVFLSVSTSDYGKICFGNHELEDPDTGYIVMSPVANSFSEFLDALYIDDSLDDDD